MEEHPQNDNRGNKPDTEGDSRRKRKKHVHLGDDHIERESSREARHRNRHAIHLVTHYYLPQDARRASEVHYCTVL